MNNLGWLGSTARPSRRKANHKITRKDTKMKIYKDHSEKTALKIINTKSSILLISLVLACFGFLPGAQAVSPAPDGGYPGGNTAEGQNALFSLTTGTYNTAVGLFSLRSNTEGRFSTAVGAGALLANTAHNNTAIGRSALGSNTIGTQNTASGVGALENNTTGSYNTATGLGALFSNTTADNNTAIGINTLLFNTGSLNTACGGNALLNNTFGDSNTAIGFNALYNNNGPANVALGAGAGYNATTGSGNVYIGAGTVGVAGESNSTYITGIYDGAIDPDSFFAAVDVNNKLGTHTTSGLALRTKDVVEGHKKVAELEATVAALATKLREQTAKLGKMKAQLEISKPATKLAGNNW